MALTVLAPVGWWLATYAIHSTILLLLAWGITKTIIRSPAGRESVWRAALLGAVLTTTAQTVFGAPVFATSLFMTQEVAAGAPVVGPESAEPLVRVDVESAVSTPETLSTDAGPTTADRGTDRVAPSAAWLLAVWTLGLLVLVARRVRAGRRLGGWLRHRREVQGGPVRHLLDDLEREAGVGRRVRLTSVAGLSSPIALGVRTQEICLPTRALAELDPGEQEAMLAHEIAHLVRGDPAWLRVQRLVTAIFFFQPLNHLAARRLHDASEMLCDAWAARRDDRRLALARCLARVANWIVERPMAVPAPAMGRRISLLGLRVRRLLDAEPLGETGTGRSRWIVGLLPVLLVAVLAPGVRGSIDLPPGTDPASFAEPDAEEPPGPFRVLDAELGALEREAQALEGLLVDAGHGDLARRIASRRAALRDRREDLRRRLEKEGDRR